LALGSGAVPAPFTPDPFTWVGKGSRVKRKEGLFTRRSEFGSVHSPMKTRIYRDPVVEAYMPGIDRTLLRENLKLTPAQRLEKLVHFSAFAAELRRAGQRVRLKKKR
jgi:hypothetical protein